MVKNADLEKLGGHYKITYSNTFSKSLKKVLKQGKDYKKLVAVVKKLAAGESLPPKNRDHNLSGNYAGFRECHIEPDWLLVYQKDKDRLILALVDTGSHSDLF